LSGGRPFYLFVGSLHPRKNLDGLLAAFAAYRARGGKADLVVVGEAMWADERHAVDGVHWLGRLGGEELASVMASAEALVFLPFFEGFGVPVVEAFACGTPVIASSLTALPEVCGGAAAALIDPTAPDAADQVAEAMFSLERDPVHRAAAVEAGLRRAADFSWDRSATLLWEAIQAQLDPL
jgi:glycosyltransferase involved in cell wall biosynthesis